ncbi:MAG: hypothetical protein U0804_21140 [Gemmataceae bacterium]
MIDTFDRDGVRFPYPGNWRPDPDAADDDGTGWTVVLQSPGTAFLLVSLRPEADDPAELADQTLAALRADYKELDADDALETIAGRAAIGHDIDFLTLDTAVVCRTRCLDTPGGPLLLMGQVGEYDRATAEPVFRAVFASLVVDGD